MTGPLALLRDRLGVEVVVAESATAATTSGRWRRSGRRSPAGRTRAVVASHVDVVDRRGAARRRRSPALAREAGARRRSSTAPSRPARSRWPWTRSAPTSTRSAARSGCSGPEGTGALVVAPRRSCGEVLRRSAGSSPRRSRTPSGVTRCGRTRGASRRPGIHKPSIVGPRPERRLAEHVRRPPVGPRARCAPGPRRGGPAGRDAGGHPGHAALADGDARLVPGRRAGPATRSWRRLRGGSSRSSARSPGSTRSA